MNSKLEEEADPNGQHVTEVLEGIPGAVVRIREGEAQVERGEFTNLDPEGQDSTAPRSG